MPSVLLRCTNAGSMVAVTLRGDLGILDTRLIGFFCSVRCPGDVILKTYDLARALRETDVTIVGGFQSPMEKEFLDLRHGVRCRLSGAWALNALTLFQPSRLYTFLGHVSV